MAMNEENNTVIDFGTGKPERWNHPELGKQYIDEMTNDINNQKNLFGEKFTKSYESYIRSRYSQKYNAAIVQQHLDENPDTPVFNSLEGFDDENKDNLIRTEFNLGPKDSITKSHENWYQGWKMARPEIFGTEDEPALFNIDAKYNQQTVKENKEWDEAAKKAVPTPSKRYEPFFQNTSPTRMGIFRNTPQVIDKSLPLYLQTANPYIPWNKDHPLRKMWKERIAGKIPIEEEEKQLGIMDELNDRNRLYENQFSSVDGKPFGGNDDEIKQIETTGYTPFLLNKHSKERQSVFKDIYKE